MGFFSDLFAIFDNATYLLSTAVLKTGEKPIKIIILTLFAGAFVLIVKVRTVTYEYAKIYPF